MLVLCTLLITARSLASAVARNLDPSPQDTSWRPLILAHVVSGSEDGVADGMCVAAAAVTAAADGPGEKLAKMSWLPFVPDGTYMNCSTVGGRV